MSKQELGNFWVLVPKKNKPRLPIITRFFTDEASARWILVEDLNLGKDYECCEVEVRRVKDGTKGRR